jgi:hypothetical protein
MDYALLEDLDRRYKRTITINDFNALNTKAITALNEDDLVIATVFGGPEHAEQLRARRDKALAPPAPPPAPVKRKAVVTEPVPEPDDDSWEAFVRRHAHQPVRFEHLDIVLGELKEQIVKRNKQIAALETKNDSHETRIVALEAKPHIKYLGVWGAEKMYGPGDGVTHSGSLWICRVAHVSGAAPGEGSSSWQLAAKRGRDGKDLR